MTVIKRFNTNSQAWEAIAVGQKGDKGDQGDPGDGLATGGVQGDILVKVSSTDFDTQWVAPTTDIIAEGSTNLYFTDQRAVDAVEAEATLDLNLITVTGLQLDTGNPATPAPGRIIWNDGDEVPQFESNGTTVDLSIELLAKCRNVTGTTIPKGTAVCIVGASANRISIAPSDRTQPGSACRTLGLTLQDIPNNDFGKVSTFGLVKGLNTNAFDEGDELFVGATPGSLSATPPDAPARRLVVGYVVTKNANVGQIFVTLRRGVRVSEIDDVQVTSLSDGDIIRYNNANSRFENVALDNTAVGLGNVTNDAQLKIASNLSDLANAGTSRTNLGLGTIATQGADDVAITGGAINGTTVGATTASTGNFTNLAYTGTLTGGTGVVNLGSGQVVKDANGNVGIGITPLAWSTTGAPSRAIELKETSNAKTASIATIAGDAHFSNNAYFSNTGWKYVANGAAANYFHDNDSHIWRTAASGVADAALTWSERMRITSGGNVGIGTTAPARTLHVNAVMRLQPTTEPSSPSAGDLYFDSGTNKLRCYDGTAWQDCF